MCVLNNSKELFQRNARERVPKESEKQIEHKRASESRMVFTEVRNERMGEMELEMGTKRKSQLLATMSKCGTELQREGGVQIGINNKRWNAILQRDPKWYRENKSK